MARMRLDTKSLRSVPVGTAARETLRRRRRSAIVNFSVAIVVVIPLMLLIAALRGYSWVAQLIAVGAVLLVMAVLGIPAIWCWSKDLTNGTVSRYSGVWHERLRRGPQTGRIYVEIKLPSVRRRLSSSESAIVQQAARFDQGASSWAQWHGDIDLWSTSHLVVAIERRVDDD